MYKFKLGDRCKILGGITYPDGTPDVKDGSLGAIVDMPNYPPDKGSVWVKLDGLNEYIMWPEEYLINPTLN